MQTPALVSGELGAEPRADDAEERQGHSISIQPDESHGADETEAGKPEPGIAFRGPNCARHHPNCRCGYQSPGQQVHKAPLPMSTEKRLPRMHRRLHVEEVIPLKRPNHAGTERGGQLDAASLSSDRVYAFGEESALECDEGLFALDECGDALLAFTVGA